MVGFAADGDRVLHVGHVVRPEHFKGVGHRPMCTRPERD